MDWFDRRIVQYVLRWAPYGRLPDEDVFPEFGMDGHQLWVRYTAIVSKLTSCDRDLDDLDRALVVRARRDATNGETAAFSSSGSVIRMAANVDPPPWGPPGCVSVTPDVVSAPQSAAQPALRRIWPSSSEARVHAADNASSNLNPSTHTPGGQNQ
jgi:hypothetical protein